MTERAKRVALLVFSVSLIAGLVPQVFMAGTVSAAEITSRSLTLQAGSAAGGSEPSGVVNHLFAFTIPTSGDISSILFQYCTTADGTCTTPSGLSTTSATLGTQTGVTFTSLVDNNGSGAGSNGEPYLTASSPITITTGTNNTVSFQLDSVTNPDGTNCSGTSGNCTFYVRISTYASTDTSGSPIDSGVVAASTAQQITLTGTMPESLIFCSGGTVSTANNVPDCTTATSGAVTFNQDFSPSSTSWATSQFAASTNASNGYAISVGGKSMTSGSNTITAIGSTAGQSQFGSSQFGMDLVLNDGSAYTNAPNITNSANVNPAPDGGNYMGTPTANFDTAGSFAFDDTAPNTIAKSDNGTGTAGPTDGQVYTASYIVNVPGNLPAGSYTTTLTYICTPTF